VTETVADNMCGLSFHLQVNQKPKTWSANKNGAMFGN